MSEYWFLGNLDLGDRTSKVFMDAVRDGVIKWWGDTTVSRLGESWSMSPWVQFGLRIEAPDGAEALSLVVRVTGEAFPEMGVDLVHDPWGARRRMVRAVGQRACTETDEVDFPSVRELLGLGKKVDYSEVVEGLMGAASSARLSMESWVQSLGQTGGPR